MFRFWLVVVELVDAYRREHRVEDRELARREAADHDAPRAEALRRELVEAHLARDCAHTSKHGALTACVEIKFRAP